MTRFDEWVLRDPDCAAYWPLRSDLRDLKAGNDLIAADVLNGRGDFTTNADAFWTLDAGWSISGGTANVNIAPGAARSMIRNASILITGKTYLISFTVSSYVSGGIRFRLGTTDSDIVSANGKYEILVTANATNPVQVYGTSALGANLSIDNLIVRESYFGDFSSIPGSCTFNGISNCLQTTQTLNLSTKNKVSIIAQVLWKDYDLVNNEAIVEFGSSITVNTDCFKLGTGGADSDELAMYVHGNVGVAEHGILPTASLVNDRKFHSLIATGNMSTNPDALLLMIDGSQRTAGAVSAANNTGNYGNRYVFVGARAGISQFTNVALNSIAILSRPITSQDEAMMIHMLLNDKYSLPRRLLSFSGARG